MSGILSLGQARQVWDSDFLERLPMPVPTYDWFIEPLVRLLVSRPEGLNAKDCIEAVADVLQLTSEDRALALASGQAVYKNRAGWAHDRLKRAGFSCSVRRGVWQATPAGIAFVGQNPTPFSSELLETLATGNNHVLLSSEKSVVDEVTVTSVSAASPDERLDSALEEIRQSVERNLLEFLGQVSPLYFETIVLDLLHRMGYGAHRADLQRVGGVGDGGIDGVISLDKLGLEKVYVQAKRWQGNVGRSEIQAFYGALAGHRSNRGVFITTSKFTPQSIDFARSVDRIVLVDGRQLAGWMIEFEVGVTSKVFKVPQIDSDYFER